MQPSTHRSPPHVSQLGVWRLITNKVFFTWCQGLLRGIRLFHSFQGWREGGSLASYQLEELRGWGRCIWEIIFPENRKLVKADCGILFIIAAFELFNTNGKRLLVLGGGGLLGMSKRRWAKNITVQIEPRVLNFKNEMNYSWIITPGSDCANTNCKRWRLWRTSGKHNTFKM